MKDLPDIALLAGVREIDGAVLLRALRQTFEARNTHALPPQLPAPPVTWAEPYLKMADEDELQWPDISVLTSAVEAFLNPVLSMAKPCAWRPAEWKWF